MDKEKREIVERTIRKYTQVKDEFFKGFIAGQMNMMICDKEDKKVS